MISSKYVKPLELFLKKTKQSNIIANNINRFNQELEFQDIKWCDIGAGNGELTQKIYSNVFKTLPIFIIEPNKEFYNILKDRFSEHDLNIFNCSLEEFVRDYPEYYYSCNVAVASHVMYYVMDSPETIFNWISSFFKLIVSGGVGFIVHQSQNGDMYDFFDKYADDRLKALPEDFLEYYIEKEKEYNVEPIICSDFEEFLGICYFLLIEPKSKFVNKDEKIREFLEKKYSKINSKFEMTQYQKLYQIRKPC